MTDFACFVFVQLVKKLVPPHHYHFCQKIGSGSGCWISVVLETGAPGLQQAEFQLFDQFSSELEWFYKVQWKNYTLSRQ